MGNLGRYACVALPFLLTLASLIALLVATLAGVANKDLYMFQVDVTNLTISPASVSNFINSRSPIPERAGFHDLSLLEETEDGSGSDTGGSTSFHDPALLEEESGSGNGATKTSNITAADLGLYNVYDITLWGYCYTPQSGDRACTKAKFNWAEDALNMTKNNVNTLITASGQNVEIPEEITSAMTAFGTITRWTEIVFIIALVALGIELFFGIFANCSRAFSCITFLIAGVATVAVCTAASLATAMSVVVVGAVEGTAKWYGVSAEFNTRFLAAVWVSAAFAIAAGLFWLFTICCCAPDHHKSSRKRGMDRGEGEKFIPSGAYQPIHDDHVYGANRHSGPQYGYSNQAHAPRRDMAYEPYSHANV